jgi:hypothetical protein
MKKNLLSAIATLLVALMLLSTLASCNTGNPSKETEAKTETSQSTDGNDTTHTETNDIGYETTDTETEENSSATESIEETEPIETVTEEDTTPMLNIDNAELIEYAERIANGVSYYYPNAKRESAILENKQMSLTYALTESGNKQVSSLKNYAGATYLKDTMDIFVRMKSGDVFYASNSEDNPTTNLFRFGYCFSVSHL